jgi:ATP-binding cassette, subfamily B, bacterial MsbA
LSDYCISRVARSVVTDFRRRLFGHYMKLPATFYDQSRSGDLLGVVIYNVEQVAQACSDSLVTVLRESSLLIGLMIVMFSISWRLSLFFVVVTPFIAWVVRWSATRLRRLSGHVQDSVGDVTSVAEEGIENYKVIRIFGGQAYEAKKFFIATKRNLQQALKVVVTNSIGSASVQILVSLPISATLFFATMPSFDFSAGGFAAIVGAMVSLLRPFRRLTTVNATFQRGIAGAESIYDTLDKDPEPDSGERQLTQSKGMIEFSNVSFRYSPDSNWVLRNVNIALQPGMTLALVGRSGGGKTTLVNLLPRFYDVEYGSIMIDGVDIKQYQLSELRSQFSMVSQNTTLFNDTIANNIAYGMEDIEESRLREVIKAACADEFIDRLPKGVNEVIGEDGVLLSGGQRQRIAIARALLKKAPILILDEATSSLDSHSERHIQQALEALMEFSTSIVIAHRLSTIENADWIAVIDEGRIVEQGTHADLMAAQGAYVELRKVQFREETEPFSVT